MTRLSWFAAAAGMLLASAASAATERVLAPADADGLLQPGDVLLKSLGPTTKITRTEQIIEGGQKLVRSLAHDLLVQMNKASPRLFHVAIYLGKGRTAEAHGGDLKTARVALRSLDDHKGYVFRVYRARDRALAAGAARVAETWANGRMHYLVPVLVPLQRANFGVDAKKEALIYGQAANTAGGPPSWKKMFCSQFVMAAYQAYSVGEDLKKNPKLTAPEVAVPQGADLQASHASPLAVHSRLERAVREGSWEDVGSVLIHP